MDSTVRTASAKGDEVGPGVHEAALDLTPTIDLTKVLAGAPVLATGVGADETIVGVAIGRSTRGLAWLTAVFWRDGAGRQLDLDPTQLRPATPRQIARSRATSDGPGSWIAQPVSTGGLLLIDRWSWPGETNVLHFGPDGHLAGRFRVGDRVQDALVDAADRLWVTYTDEADERVALQGLARFGLDGRCTTPPEDRMAPWGTWNDAWVPGGLNDAWALNVDGLDAWLVYDRQVPQEATLLHLDAQDRATTWAIPISTCHGVAVSPGAATILDYDFEGDGWDQPLHSAVFAFGFDRLDLMREVRAAGLGVPGDRLLVGRGDGLWLYRQGVWSSGRITHRPWDPPHSQSTP